MSLSGKRFTEPPEGVANNPPPLKRRRGKNITGRFSTIPPGGNTDIPISSNADDASAEGASSSNVGRRWEWDETTTSRTTEFRKRTIPIDLSAVSGEPNPDNGKRRAVEDPDPGTWDPGPNEYPGSDIDQEGISHRSRGKV